MIAQSDKESETFFLVPLALDLRYLGALPVQLDPLRTLRRAIAHVRSDPNLERLEALQLAGWDRIAGHRSGRWVCQSVACSKA